MIKCTIVVGVTPGYGHNNEGAADEAATLKAAVEAAKKIADKIQAATGLYPSFVASPARVGYKAEWGCPEGGEFVVQFSGNQNPEFCKNPSDYEATWRLFGQALRAEFGQTTATLEVSEVELHYLK